MAYKLDKEEQFNSSDSGMHSPAQGTTTTSGRAESPSAASASFPRTVPDLTTGRKNKSNNKKENTMKRRLQRLWLALVTLVLFAPSLALAAGAKAAPVVIVADTRKLDGLMAWWANLYNESHLQFMILTVIIVPVTGVVFGVIADIVMGWIGIDLKSRELAEH